MITVVGGGLAGVEAAWAAAQRNCQVELIEMRPVLMTPAHKTGDLAELVCSNSLKSDNPDSPAGLLKREMELLGSLIVPIARKHAVPAGQALAVDRVAFSSEITSAVEQHPNIAIRRLESEEIPSNRPAILATGPLTSERLHQAIQRLTGEESLYFYDAAAPCVDAGTIDMTIAFNQSRYDKGEGDDYINCPFTKDEYELFYQAIMEAELTPLHDFEEPKFFEGCLPLEEIARRGMKSLAFGPLKPVGLTDPRTGRRPYAVLQLRPENKFKTMYSLVACQTRMTWGSQNKVFRLAPGLQNAEFLRYGVMHRNTYMHSPTQLSPELHHQSDGSLFFAGQIIGVEGYLESAAMGILAGINAAFCEQGKECVAPPIETVIGSLIHYISTCPNKQFAPMNANWGLLPDQENMPKDKALKRQMKLYAAKKAMDEFLVSIR